MSVRVGRMAEQAAADWLFANGYRVVGNNVRVGHDEIDLLALQDTRLVVVEVRTRAPGSYETALASVSVRKRERIKRAAQRAFSAWVLAWPEIERVRYDVICVTLSGSAPTRVEHIEGAFV